MTCTTIPSSAVVAAHKANACTGETPFWDEILETLWWIDVQGQRLLGHVPDYRVGKCFNLPSQPGLVLRCADGLILGLEDGLYMLDTESGYAERVVAVEGENFRTRINDGKPDMQGRLWFGTMEKTGSSEPIGRLYRMDCDGSLTVFRENIGVPNSITFSPAGDRMYFCDSRSGVLNAFRYDTASGWPDVGEAFATVGEGEIPDGSCVDAEGALWFAVVNGRRLERRLPDGSLDTIVELPTSRPTMPMLGGTDGQTLFVTSQRRHHSFKQLQDEPLTGDLLALRVDVPGFTLPDVQLDI